MNNKQLEGVVCGLALGFIASTILFWSLASTKGTIAENITITFSSVGALALALIALKGVSNQIQNNIDLFEKTRLAKLEASKATLPIVLSNISTLCEERSLSIAKGIKDKPNRARWEISDFELNTLKECIEHADDTEKELMQRIMRVYQILIARWRNLEFEDIFNAPTLAANDPKQLERKEQLRAITNWITLREISNSLFNYARGRSSNPSSEKLKNSILNELEYMNMGGRSVVEGKLLIENGDYYKYIRRLADEGGIEFVYEL